MARQFRPGQLQTGSLYNISSSFAVTASFAVNGGSAAAINTGSFATTGSNVFIGNQTITGSVYISGSEVTITPNILNIQTPDGSYTLLQIDNTGVHIDDTNGNSSIDAENRQLYAANGSTIVIDWDSRQLLDTNGVTIDWESNQLISTGNRISIDWENRELVASNGLDHVLNWNTKASAWFSGSVAGTSSWAINAQTASYASTAQTASYYQESDPIFISLSGSYTTTASFTQFTSSIQQQVNSLTAATGSYILASQTSSMSVLSSSYAMTASYVDTAQTASYTLQAVSASYSITASHAISASFSSQSISSSFAATASFAPDYVLSSATSSMLQPYVLTSSTSSMSVLSSSYASTASYAETAQTASYVLQAVSSSFAATASYYQETDPVFTAVSGTFNTTASFNAFTASYNTASFSGSFTGNLIGTASWAQNASTASYIQTAQTASYVLQAVSSSFTTTASYAASASHAVTSSHAVSALSSSYSLTSTSASYVHTASYVDPLHQNVIITGSLNITGSINNVNTIQFNTSSAVTLTPGGINWDDGTGTLNVLLKGGNIDLQVGQENVVLVYNGEGTTVNKGEVVYVSGSQGNRPSVKRAVATSDGYSVTTLGIAAENITSGAEGYVTTFGMINNLNTNGATGGAPVWLSPSVAGGWTTTKPQAPNHTVLLGYIVRVSNTVGSVFVHISNGWELEELHNVLDTTTTASYGDILVKSGSLWINSKQLTGSYGLTGSLTATQITASGLYADNTYISGSLTVVGNSTFIGSSSFLYVTASQLAISSSFISVNVFEPLERFGGLKVYDSGSSLATASLAWDSLHNHWVYQNIDGATYTGGMLLSGPRNTGSLGDEPNLTKWFIPRSDGGDHLDNSQIFSSESIHIVTGSLTVTQGITGSLLGTATNASTASYIQTAQTASYVLQAVSASYAPDTTFPYTGSAIVSGSLRVTGSFSVLDDNGFNNINTTVRSLYAGGNGVISLDWTNRVLTNSSGITVVDWRNYRLIDTSTTRSIDWQNRTLLDTTQANVFNWSNGQALWSNRLSLDWQNRKLYDTSPILSANWASRTLHDTSTTQSVDWQNRRLVDSTSVQSADWQNRYTIDASGITSINWDARRHYDTSTSSSINWGSRTLNDSSEFTSVDWENRQTFDVSNNISSDWNGRVLYDIAGTSAVDWQSRQLVDGIGNGVFLWDVQANYYTTYTNYYHVQDITDLDLFSQQTANAFAGLTQNISGEVIPAVGILDAGVSIGNLVYLNSDGIWYKTDQTSVSSSYMLGVCVETAAGKERVFLEGNIGFTTSSVANSPLVTGTNFYGVPIYISGSDGAMSTEKPTSGVVRIVGHAFYNSVTTPTNWLMKFRPSNDWYEI